MTMSGTPTVWQARFMRFWWLLAYCAIHSWLVGPPSMVRHYSARAHRAVTLVRRSVRYFGDLPVPAAQPILASPTTEPGRRVGAGNEGHRLRPYFSVYLSTGKSGYSLTSKRILVKGFA